MNKIKKIILTTLGVYILFQILIRIFRKNAHFPCPAFMGGLLDSNFRRYFQPPDKLIQRSGIEKGMHVLEIGCGSGAFTTYVAKAVGKKGKVYALDIQQEMLKQLERKLSRSENKDIKNIELINSNAYELPFDNNSLDLIYMITVLPEIPDKNKALKEIKRALKTNGILAVTELLPDPDYPLKSTTIKLGEKSGFVLDKVSGNFWNYTVKFKKC